jgi:F-type H+-transporting ATPase subunit gamma
MPSLAELRKKIKGISSTRQITKAMKMVAGARFSRAARQMNDARCYETELAKLLSDFLSAVGTPKGRFSSLCLVPTKIEKGDAQPPKGKTGLFVVAADKGLCGDFNNSILREADGFIKKNGDRLSVFFAVGRKAVEHYKNAPFPHKIDRQHFFNRFDFGTADTIGDEALRLYFDEDMCEYAVVHSHFKSRIKQQVTITRLLPVEPVPPKDTLSRSTIIEPAEEEEVLQALLPMYVKAKIYGILRDSFTAELAARMRAMDDATRNAGSLIDSITLEMNKVRQAVITRELSEIIATNEVVK